MFTSTDHDVEPPAAQRHSTGHGAPICWQAAALAGHTPTCCSMLQLQEYTSVHMSTILKHRGHQLPCSGGCCRCCMRHSSCRSLRGSQPVPCSPRPADPTIRWAYCPAGATRLTPGACCIPAPGVSVGCNTHPEMPTTRSLWASPQHQKHPQVPRHGDTRPLGNTPVRAAAWV